MLLLIDCKYKLEERQDVRKYYKVTSVVAPIQADTEEKEGLLTKEENGITDMEVKENGMLHDERIQMENPDRDKEVSICPKKLNGVGLSYLFLTSMACFCCSDYFDVMSVMHRG